MNSLKLLKIGNIFFYIYGVWATLGPLSSIYKYRVWWAELTENTLNENIYKPVFYIMPGMVICLGILIFILIYFGLNKKLRWTWYSLFIITYLPNIPNLVGQLSFQYPPLAIIPLVFGSFGLAFTYPYIFSKK